MSTNVVLDGTEQTLFESEQLATNGRVEIYGNLTLAPEEPAGQAVVTFRIYSSDGTQLTEFTADSSAGLQFNHLTYGVDSNTSALRYKVTAQAGSNAEGITLTGNYGAFNYNGG